MLIRCYLFDGVDSSHRMKSLHFFLAWSMHMNISVHVLCDSFFKKRNTT